jgi:hypothetical protein
MEEISMRLRFWFIVSLLLTVALAGCATPEFVATPTVTRTPLPAATDTPVPPTATPPPRPTNTPAPTLTPEVFVVTPFPRDVNPFTGLKVDDEALLDRIPVAIKISNSPEARPQSGLGEADLVFEHYSEGGITRFTTIFYVNEPAKVGSVRSGRLIDIEVPAMYQAIFGYSGSSAGVKELIRASDLFPTHIAAPDFGVGQPTFYRVPQPGKAFEHTLFTNPTVLRQLADNREINERPEWETYAAFDEQVPPGGQPASAFRIMYLPGACTAEWAYDEATGLWDRSMVGRMHVDALTGEQITAANVVMVYANHIYTDFWEEMIGARSNWKLSIQVQLWGEGTALVFRDGQVIPGIWRREGRNDMLTFYHGDGTPLPLKPGNSWMQVVPLDNPVEEVGDGVFVFTPKKM